MSLFENENYKVVVGESIDYDGPTKPRLLYQIVNTKTDVIEREDFMYPSAVDIARRLNEDVMAIELDLKDEDVLDQLVEEGVAH
jgi:hypothetical protein